MAVLKNKTQNNFTMISNNILRDKELSMKDRGVLCTIISLPDGWDFSIAGLSALVPEGKDSIRKSVIKLEKLSYIVRRQFRNAQGKYETEIEVYPNKLKDRENGDEFTVADLPTRDNRNGLAVTVNPTEYNTDNKKLNINKDNIKSINLSSDVMDGEIDIIKYKELIAENIKLEWLLEIANNHNEDEMAMVNEVYGVICDMVCYPRENVTIRGVTYPWEVVKLQFLKLKYQHIADILNRIVDKELNIKNMSAYLVSTLYTQSTVGTLEAQANLTDDYLKFLRGSIY